MEDCEVLLEEVDDETQDEQEDRNFDAESGQDYLKPRAAFTPWPHVFNLANCIVGVSVLAMPFVFQQCGILLATVMIAASSVLTKYTCHFLAKSAYITSKHSYEALALTALGPTGRRVIELCLLCFLVSSIVAFLVVIGDLGPHIVADYLELEAPTQRLRTLVMVVVMLFIIFPLCLIKDLEKFSVISTFAVLFYAIFVCRMVLEALPSLWDGKWSIHVSWWRPQGFLTCLPIVFMGLSCQVQLFSVIDYIHESLVTRVDAIVSGAINFCSALYAGVGLFGYVAFFSRELHGDVLIEMESSYFTQLLKIAFLLSVAVSIPLMMFPARSALFNLVLRPSGCELPVSHAIRFSTFHVLTFVILFSNLIVALLIPNVEFILGLTGASIGSLVSIVIPSILYIAVAKNKEHYTVFYAKVCLAAGLFIWCASTWATLHVDRTVYVAEKPMPKDGPIDKPALKSLQKLEEKVLDANLNISAKLDNIADLAAVGKDKEAERLLVEMKEERKKQEDLIRKQEKIVEELHKHVEEHEKAGKKSVESKGKVGTEANEVTKSAEKREANVAKLASRTVKAEETSGEKNTKKVGKAEVVEMAEGKKDKKEETAGSKQGADGLNNEKAAKTENPKSAELSKKEIVSIVETQIQTKVAEGVKTTVAIVVRSNASKTVDSHDEKGLRNVVPVPELRNVNVPSAGSTKKSIEHVDV